MTVSKKTQNRLLDYYSNIHNRYDIVNRLFTFGRDIAWRADAAVACMEDDPEEVLDVCCGTGDLLIGASMRTKKQSNITGYDFSRAMLSLAKTKLGNRGLDRIRLVQGDAGEMPFSDCSFDCLTIGFGIRNLVFENPLAKKRLGEMCRVVRDGGKMVVLESGIPSSRIIKIFHALFLYLFLVPLGGIISGDWKAYAYLARSSSRFRTRSEIEKTLQEKGFAIVTVKEYFFGAVHLIVAIKKQQNSLVHKENYV